MTLNDSIMIHRSLAELLTQSAVRSGNQFSAEHERMAQAHAASADEAQRRVDLYAHHVKLAAERRCEVCGEPMPAGEEMFTYHGHSGPCPKEPLTQLRPGIDDDPDFDAVGDAIQRNADERNELRPGIDETGEA